jgi:protoporphyrinogen oxidase
VSLTRIKNVILGSGISGISAGYHLKKQGVQSVIFEKDDDWGGLCGNFEVEGFRFDKAIHLSFTEDEYVKSIFSKSTDYIIHDPLSYNYYKGCWLKHPAQNNLYPLDSSEKIKIIKDFIQNNNKKNNLNNYEEWLRAQYGDYFSENFPMAYTKKYWGCEAKELSTTWVGKRMYSPDIEEVLKGAFEPETPNTYYAKEMRYPQKGGYRSFLNFMADQCDIRLNKKVIEIDTQNKKVFFEDGKKIAYDNLISSLPLPEMKNLILEMPDRIKTACDRLQYTQISLVNLGFKRKDIPNCLWFYIYDEDYFSARCNSPSFKSANNAPEGCSSFQFEIYHLNTKRMGLSPYSILNNTIDQGVKMGLFDYDDIAVKEYQFLPYGNVVFYHGMEEDRNLILDYLTDRKIKCVGRFGCWDYFWSDQSLQSGNIIIS